MTKRILLLTYAFPPLGFPSAFVCAKCLGSLPGFSVDVVTAEPPEGWDEQDHSLDAYVAERFGAVTRVSGSRLWDLVRFGRFAPIARPPDAFRVLNGPVRRAAAERLRGDGYAAIVTWSQMHAIQLVGRTLKRRLGLPWIAYLTDPWATNPFLSPTRLESALNRRLEAAVFEGADLLVFPSAETAAISTDPYGPEIRRKVEVIPHTYDPRLFPEPAPPRGSERRLFRYLGAFYSARSPRPLFASLARLNAETPDVLGRIAVEIVGRVEPELLEDADFASLPPGTVTIRPPVEYARSLELMAEADGLLIVDAPGTLNPFLPSKIADYIGAGRPIAALTPAGPAAELTRLLGGPVADPADPDAGAEALRRLLQLADETGTAPFGPADVRRAYEVDAVGERMAELVRRTIEGRAGSGLLR